MTHNIVPYNQLRNFHSSEDQMLDEYYDCIVECREEQGLCKRYCRSILER